jgi:hypothetical protein
MQSHGDVVAQGRPGLRHTAVNRFAAGIHGREVGRRLRAIQRTAGLDGITLATALGTSESLISRMMNGIYQASMVEVAAVLAVCGVVGQERDQILDLCHPRHDGGVLRLSDGTQWDAYLYHLGEADRLVEYQPLTVPSLVQTEDYAQAWCSPPVPKPWATTDDDLATTRVAATELRSGLDRVELLVHEFALWAPVGTHQVRSVQMRHLVAVSKRSSVSVRVIPAWRPLPVAALSGFAMLESDRRPTVVHREEPASGVFIDDADQVAVYRSVAGSLRQLALSESRSRELLEQIAEEPELVAQPVDLFQD